MKLTKEKIKEFFKIEIDYHGEHEERHFKATISLWHFVCVGLIMALIIYRYYH